MISLQDGTDYHPSPEPGVNLCLSWTLDLMTGVPFPCVLGKGRKETTKGMSLRTPGSP